MQQISTPIAQRTLVKNTRRSKLWIMLLIVVGVTLVGVLCGCDLIDPGKEDVQRFKSIKVGTAKKDVISNLGEPYKSYSKDTAPEDYYVHGYEYRERAINHELLIYIYGDAICYVYVDSTGKVEHVFVGRS